MQMSWNYQLFYECTADENRTHGVRSKSNRIFYALLAFGSFIGFIVMFIWLFWTGMSGSLKIGTVENGLFAIPVLITIPILLVAIPTVLIYSYKNIKLCYNRKYLKRRKEMKENKEDLRTTLLSLYNLMKQHFEELNQVEINLKQRLHSIIEKLNQVFGNMDLFLAGSVAEKYCIAITQGGKEERIPERIRHAVLSDNDCMLTPSEWSVSFQDGVGKYQIVSEGKHLKAEVPYFLLQDENGDFLSAIKVKELIFNIVFDTYRESCTNCFSAVSTYSSFYQICTCQRNFQTVDIKGPAVRYELGDGPFVVNRFCSDLVFAPKCFEWPEQITDWGIRENQLWPNREEIIMIKSQGCHFVPKSDQNEGNELTWRISFSNAENELSKSISPTARMCMIGMKILTKDYLSVICRELTSYHIKSIFLFMLERNDPSLWNEENLENCFLQLLTRVKKCVEARLCPNFWLPSLNMFKDFTNENVKTLVEQIERIEKAPSKFIEPFDKNISCITKSIEDCVYAEQLDSRECFWLI